MSKAYEELVAKAEAAVSSVKDPELRRVAFEKVLDDLLGKNSAAASRPVETTNAQPTRKRGGRPQSGTSSSERATGPYAYAKELAEEGFFKKPKSIADVRTELANRGHHIPVTSLSGPLQKLCQRKILRRQKTKMGNKETFNYSNW